MSHNHKKPSDFFPAEPMDDEAVDFPEVEEKVTDTEVGYQDMVPAPEPLSRTKEKLDPKKKPTKPVKGEDMVPAVEVPVGCEHCDSTGLEPGFGVSEGRWCTVCHGSPFTVKVA